MVKRILIFIFWLVILIVIVLWIMGGGVSRAIATARTYGNPVNALWTGSTTGNSFQLPGQPAFPQGPNLPQTSTAADPSASDTGTDNVDAQIQLVNLQMQYQALKQKAIQQGAIPANTN